jgi:hypothetical protein
LPEADHETIHAEVTMFARNKISAAKCQPYENHARNFFGSNDSGIEDIPHHNIAEDKRDHRSEADDQNILDSTQK